MHPFRNKIMPLSKNWSKSSRLPMKNWKDKANSCSHRNRESMFWRHFAGPDKSRETLQWFQKSVELIKEKIMIHIQGIEKVLRLVKLFMASITPSL